MPKLVTLLVLATLGVASRANADAPSFRLSTFQADVTPPMGHPLMGGGIAPAKEVIDRVQAKGVILIGGEKPVVIVAVDWCEIRNEAYDRWRTAIAEAVGTDRARVLVSSNHQHDVPVADLDAERILLARGLVGRVTNLEFHEEVVRRVAKAAAESIPNAKRVTHLGTGQAKVVGVASNRRYLRADGSISFDRTSASKSAEAQSQPEGIIDPWLKTLSFWDGETPLAALSIYATHPMSFYGKGGVTKDFVGLAREARQAANPSVFQIYASGCSGNVTAGKYNDGSPANRGILAGKIEAAMAEAFLATTRHPLTCCDFRVVPLRLEPRNDEGFTPVDLEKRLSPASKPFDQCLAAMGLSWRKRADAGATIDVPALDFGPAQWLLLPGESYVEYQLYAQSVRPDSFVLTSGYGECATGYVPTERAIAEHDTNLHDWCWVAPGAEPRMHAAIRAVLEPHR
ncbi:hypothetical protein EP7_004762 [Isosphaeraceae bacterium EP7]